MEDDFGDILLKLSLALLVGTAIGAEREYKNKSAGLRTLVLICLGSTVFTIISGALGAENETARIAANIVTGIGFLGAGAIMREGLTVSGLTTASSVWVTAALGMAVGAGEYSLSIITTIIVIAVLTLFGYIQPMLERHRKFLELHVTLANDHQEIMEDMMTRYGLRHEKIRTLKEEGDTVIHYNVLGPKGQIELFLKTLNTNAAIKSFEY